MLLLTGPAWAGDGDPPVARTVLAAVAGDQAAAGESGDHHDRRQDGHQDDQRGDGHRGGDRGHGDGHGGDDHGEPGPRPTPPAVTPVAIVTKPASVLVPVAPPTPTPTATATRAAVVPVPPPAAAGPAAPPLPAPVSVSVLRGPVTPARPGVEAASAASGAAAAVGLPAVPAAVALPAPDLAGRAGGIRGDVTVPQLVSLMGLPVLVVLWCLAAVRMLARARMHEAAAARRRGAGQRGVAPAERGALGLAGRARLRDQVATDELTGVIRRAAGLAAAEREVGRAHRSGRPLAAAFVDVDGLKRVNDARGHAAGDALLRGVTGALKGRLRAEDVIFRYGGDEFVCLLPGSTAAAAAAVLSEALAAARTEGNSFSIGLASLRQGEDARTLLARADADLYARRSEKGHPSR